MVRFIRILYILFFLLALPAGMQGKKLKTVHLYEYGSIDNASIENTISKAISDLDGKRLLLPDIPINCNEIKIVAKNNFIIEGDKQYPITCNNIQIIDCNHFELTALYVKGTVEKFTVFNVEGDCSDFSIHDCLLDSEKQEDGHNTLYGIHIIADTNKKDINYSNSPRNFHIYNNLVKNTRYDGILAHACCSDFVIENNRIEGAECIGIEVEGRFGGAYDTEVHPCKKAIIRHNTMFNCGGWGVLLMWTSRAKVYGNKSYNSFGAFLSIGCRSLSVRDNLFEGSGKAFEISNEFYKVANGINENIKVKNNIIKGFARAWNRGVLDIQHAKNVIVKNNQITSVDRENSCYVSVGSSQGIKVTNNHFYATKEPLATAIQINNVFDPETKEPVPQLDIHDVVIKNNTFHDIPDSILNYGIDMEKSKVVIVKNIFK